MSAFIDLKSTINRTLRRVGYEIRSVGRAGTAFEQIIPYSTYSPWNEDLEFQRLFQKIRPNTMTDLFRCHSLWKLVEQTAKIEGALVEVGVWRGGSGAIIAKKAELCNIKDTVYLCDTFTGVVKASQLDEAYVGGEHANTSQETVQQLLAELSIENVKILKGIFPDETADQIKENKIRFCHIDVDVYQSAREVFEWIWPKLSVGGIIVYDDFGFEGLAGIRKHIQEVINQKNLVFIHNINGHGIIIKTSAQ